MAEGPQVRLRAAWLHSELAGRRIERAESPRHDLASLAASLSGREVVRAFARGESLFVELEGGQFLHNHLRTDGRWRRLPGPESAAPSGAWLVLRLSDRALCNLHGQLLVLLDVGGVRARVESLGVDVMDEPFPEEAVVRALASAGGTVCEVLADPAVLCGIGSVIRTEALFLAGLHPARTAHGLSPQERRALASALAGVTRESLAAGGRWVRRVHQRAGEPCPRCGATIELVRAGRPPSDTYLCRGCQPPGPALVAGGATPRARSGELRLGLAVWAHAPWVGTFYPAGTRPRDYLRLYAERLPAVEGNSTFYAAPPTETLVRWRGETPPGFRLCPRLPRAITHRERLAQGCGEALAFLAHMRALGDRLGPVLAQLPPTLGPERADELAAFLDAWPGELTPLAVEVRHPAWFQLAQLERLDTLLAERGASRAILDSRPIHEEGPSALPPELRRKPRLPVLATAPGPVALVRFVAHPDPQLSRRWMREWLEPLGRWVREGRDVYAFIHCPREELAPALAREMHALLRAGGVPLMPLPWGRVELEPGSSRQLELF